LVIFHQKQFYDFSQMGEKSVGKIQLVQTMLGALYFALVLKIWMGKKWEKFSLVNFSIEQNNECQKFALDLDNQF
jgi:hypothetical protein